jgi:hypothetical protein
MANAGNFQEIDLRMNKIVKKLNLSCLNVQQRNGDVLDPIEGRALSFWTENPDLPATALLWNLSGINPKFALHHFPIHFSPSTACLSATQFACVPTPINSPSRLTIAIFDIVE